MPQEAHTSTEVPGGDDTAASRAETPMQDASSTKEVPGGHRLPVVSQEKPVPPGIPPDSCTAREPTPAAPTADQNTEANMLKETLHSIKEMIQAQTCMLQTLTTLMQQMIQYQKRHDPILPAEQANGANI